VGLCGTPGTGKKTLAPVLARRLRADARAINSFAPAGALEVDPRALREALLESTPAGAVLYGHLLPHVLRRGEARFVAVLRCEPRVLKGRLEKRRYPAEKVTENVEAELIGVVLDECVRRFGSAAVHEYDTTTSRAPSRLAARIVSDMGLRRNAKKGWIDWTLDYDSSTKLRSLLGGGGVAPPPST
jgi:adenylate kinase